MVTLYIRESYYRRGVYRVETVLEKDLGRVIANTNGDCYRMVEGRLIYLKAKP